MQPRLQPSEARAPKKSVKGGRASWRISVHKIGNETVQPDNPQTRGKIAKIGYLLKVTEE